MGQKNYKRNVGDVSMVFMCGDIVIVWSDRRWSSGLSNAPLNM